MKTRLLLFTWTFLLLIFYIPYVYAQENIETWSLTIENLYKIPIVTENLIIDYIRAESGNKILMYLSMEDSQNNGSIEFTFPEGAMSEIFNDSTCDLEFVQGVTELSVYVNQNKYSRIVPHGEENAKLSITLPPESSHVTIEGPCNNVLSNPEHQVYNVQVKSHDFSIPYLVTDSFLEKINVDCDSTALIIHFQQTGNQATLSIDIPRTLLDIQSDKRENRDNLFTIMDGQEVEHHQIHSSSESRALLIPIPPGGKVLEIIASSVGMFPEPVTCGIAGSADSFYHQLLSPLQQYKNEVHRSEIICRNGLELAIKSNDLTPACVTPQTKSKLMERGWGDITPLETIREEPSSITNNIVKILDGHVAYLYPLPQCYSISVDKLGEYDIKRYENEGLGFKDIFELKQKDLNDLPVVEELIYGTQQIKPLLNDESRVGMSIKEFVDYETFLMNKSIAKYGDSQEDYFRSFDIDFNRNPEESHTFENDFESPWIVYNSTIYEVRGTTFMIDDLDEPRYFILYPRNDSNHHKFVVLDEEDMESIPLLRQAMAEIGTMTELVTAFKGVDKETKSHYNDWFYKNLNSDWGLPKSQMFKHDSDFYSIEFNRHCT